MFMRANQFHFLGIIYRACVLVCVKERERECTQLPHTYTYILMHVMWGGNLLPLLNGIRVINQLFTKRERTSLSCFVSSSLPLSLTLSLYLTLSHFSLSFSLSLSLIPNQRDSLEVPWGWIRMSAAAQSGLLSHTGLCSMYKFTHTHTENSACKHSRLCMDVCHSHAHPTLADTVFSEHMSYDEYISYMHSHTREQKATHGQTWSHACHVQ